MQQQAQTLEKGRDPGLLRVRASSMCASSLLHLCSRTRRMGCTYLKISGGVTSHVGVNYTGVRRALSLRRETNATKRNAALLQN